MNIQQIEYAIAVSELASFGKAAKQCFVTQSTLSTMVSRFEAEIGIRLFDRRTNPISVTQEGGVAIQQLKTIARELEQFNKVISELKGEEYGELRIGVIPTVAPYLMPLFLTKFIRANSKFNFVLAEMTTENIITKIKSRELDIGILSTPLLHRDIIETPLYHEPFLLYDGSKKFDKAKPVDVKDINGNKLWLLNEGHCLRTQTEAICGLRKNRTLNRNLDYESGTIDTLLRFVKKNRALTLLPYLATIDFDEEELSCLRRFNDPVPVREISLVTHAHFTKNKIFELLEKEILGVVKPFLPVDDLEEWKVDPV